MAAIPTLIRSNISTIVVIEPIRRPLLAVITWEGSGEIVVGTSVMVDITDDRTEPWKERQTTINR